jgi:hypothetical protein
MDLAAIGSNLQNKNRRTFWIFGVFLHDYGGSRSRKHVINREPIVRQGVIAVLGDPDVTSRDQSRELLPEAGHHTLSGCFSSFA